MRPRRLGPIRWPWVGAVALSPALLAAGCHELGLGAGVPVVTLRTAWRAVTPGTGTSFWIGRPAVDAGRVFIQEANLAMAIDAAHGTTLWQRPIRIAPLPPPTILLAGGGRVFISEVDSVLALDAATGHTVWAFHPDSQAIVEPAVDESAVYTGQRGIPVVYALDRADGTLRWRTNIGVGYHFAANVTGVAVRGDTVYAAVRRDLSRGSLPVGTALVALHRGDGHELWRLELPTGRTPPAAPTDSGYHGVQNAPLPAGPYVLLTEYFGNAVTAIDIATRQPVWSAATPGPVRVSERDGVVYVATIEGPAYALDLKTGARRWRSPSFGSAFGGVYCAGAYFVNDQRLERVDAITGTQTGHLAPGRNSDAFTSDMVADGTRVYFTATDGTYAVECR